MRMCLNFRRDSSLIGRAIRLLTCEPGTKVASNHVWIQFFGDGIDEGYEATGGRRFRRIEDCDWSNRELFPLNSTTWSLEICGDAEAARVWCMAADSCQANRYGYLQIVQSMVRILTGIHIGLAESPWESSWVCSEAAMRTLFVSQRDFAYEFVRITNLGEMGWDAWWPSGGRRGGSVWDIATKYMVGDHASQISIDGEGQFTVTSINLRG